VAFTSPTAWTVFAPGADGRIRTLAAGGRWSSIDAPPFWGRPSAVVDDAGRVHLTVRNRTDEIWERTRDGATWSSWTNLGGTLSGSPTLMSTSGRVYLFAVAADNRLWQRNYVDGAWGGWFQRGEFSADALQGAVGAVAGANGSAWIAVRGIDRHVHRVIL
jgi:alpha-galactosidase